MKISEKVKKSTKETKQTTATTKNRLKVIPSQSKPLFGMIFHK